MNRRKWAIGVAAALLAVGWSDASASAQLYYGAGGVGSGGVGSGGVGNSFGPAFYGRPGRITFGNNFSRGAQYRAPTSYYPYGNNPYGYGYGFNPYVSYYSGPGFYSGPSYYPPAIAEPPPPARDSARLPPANPLPMPDPNVAYIDLQVPGNAEIWAEGVKMDAKGTFRRFVTPALDPAHSYSYEFRIVYPENGQDVTLVRHISVRAGDRKSLTIFPGSAGK